MSLREPGYRALRSLVRQHPRVFLVSTALRSGAAMIIALHPWFLAELATSGGDEVGRWVALLFGTGVVHLLLWTGCDYYVSRNVVPLHWEFKRRAFDTVWAEPYRRFVDRPSGKTASYVNDIRNHVVTMWDTVHYGFLPVLATIPIYVVLLWQTSPGNALVYALFLVVAGSIITLLARPLNRRQRILTDGIATNGGRVFDSYANFVNVFSFRAQRKERRRNDQQIDGVASDDVAFNEAASTYWGVASVLVRVVLWGAIIGVSWFQYDRGAITLTALVVSVTVTIDFTNQYWNVVHFTGEWIDKSAAFREAYGYLFGERDIVADGPDEGHPTPERAHVSDGAAAPERRLRDQLEIRDLRFAYPDDPDRLVLDGIDLTVRRGERLGVVGRSGEGKSTLIKILLGFYAPTSGEILIDGRPATSDDLAAIQSYVPQDTSLFQETIEYNIGYAESGPVDPSAIRAAAERANIADFVESLPDGYLTMVGERGIKLSLGQRQRIAIARAFVKESELVILDEATSALDSETEARIHEALLELWQDRAAIVIAHRLATLNDMDRIVVVEGGRIVEEGSRDELLDRAGRFADMWGLQRSGLA